MLVHQHLHWQRYFATFENIEWVFAGLDDTAATAAATAAVVSVQLNEWMNIFKLWYALNFRVLYLCICYSVCFSLGFRWNFTVTMRTCLIVCAVSLLCRYRYRCIFAVHSWFRSMKAKVFGMWQYNHKKITTLPAFYGKPEL